ncbi:Lrp/AsnC family transcriptional regulator [Mycetocola reblochoni]|uniref:Transcriptional regulator, AsnC family n=2 Tax=Mycetocola reblochoni TaxID=331618 RepID=A0A1R4ITW2_9MICO|nr:Lrp/AsnC ligand binding domain-containing protein [Mycetocola reblochoni]RLP71054.1 winged helix-turn-helix transcriptional regulator [Mycetocola reblochoni]SJN23119.1 Transcriptional regulator, AsnC family [Mycetocola reblochoni REB411]
MSTLDDTDRRILRFLDDDPRATVQLIAQSLGIARGTVHSRLERFASGTVFLAHSTRVTPEKLGLPFRAIVRAEVDQEEFESTVADLTEIPEIVECLAVAGSSDLHLDIVAKDADDVYLITQRVMLCRGIRRTETAIVLRKLITRRQHQLL